MLDKFFDQSRVYPQITVENNQNPSRFFAVPLLGILVKMIALIPVFIMLFFFSIYYGILVLINSFVVLFTGKYLKRAYDVSLGMINLTLKTAYYIAGITDKYPGFNLSDNGLFKVNLPYPDNPNRLFAFPILGGVVRVILLIPFLIYQNIVQYAVMVGVYFFAWFFVLFKGRYPESAFEIGRDFVRLQVTSMVYMAGLSDQYPSFWISMNHKRIKIALLIVGTILAILNIASDDGNRTDRHPYSQNTELPELLDLRSY